MRREVTTVLCLANHPIWLSGGLYRCFGPTSSLVSLETDDLLIEQQKSYGAYACSVSRVLCLRPCFHIDKQAKEVALGSARALSAHVRDDSPRDCSCRCRLYRIQLSWGGRLPGKRLTPHLIVTSYVVVSGRSRVGERTHKPSLGEDKFARASAGTVYGQVERRLQRLAPEARGGAGDLRSRAEVCGPGKR